MAKFLTRPDEGKFFSLTYKHEEADGNSFLDRQAGLDEKKASEFSKDVPSKAERLSYYD